MYREAESTIPPGSEYKYYDKFQNKKRNFISRAVYIKVEKSFACGIQSRKRSKNDDQRKS